MIKSKSSGGHLHPLLYNNNIIISTGYKLIINKLYEKNRNIFHTSGFFKNLFIYRPSLHETMYFKLFVFCPCP